MTFTSGKKIFFKSNNTEYEVIDKLGEGGQGVVYRAKNLSDGKCYALKELIECSDAKRKNIKNIIEDHLNERVSKSGDSNKIHFCFPFAKSDKVTVSTDKSEELYVMDMGCGDTLTKLFKNGIIQKMALTDKLKLARQIAKSIEILNLLGRSYTDISPSNFMLDIKSGWLYIIDCENSASNQDIKDGKFSFVMGTGAFMAPEVAFELANAGMNADRYAIAVLFLRLFTNNLIDGPYDGKIMYSYGAWANMEEVKELVDDYDIDEAWSVFIFDENDHRNGIVDVYKDADASKPNQLRKRRELDEAIRLWDELDDKLKALFRKAFKNPLQDYDSRPSPSAWGSVLDSVLKKLQSSPIPKEKKPLSAVGKMMSGDEEAIPIDQIYKPFVPAQSAGTGSSDLGQLYKPFIPEGRK